jgi:hypothetical protein
MSKVNALHHVILTLADFAHHERLKDLLNALETEVASAVMQHAAEIVQVKATDADIAYYPADNARIAKEALTDAAHDLRYAECRSEIWRPKIGG